SDDEDLSEPEEMSEDDEEVDLSRHHAEINSSSSSDSNSDYDDNCFVHPASGIVAHQPPPLLHREMSEDDEEVDLLRHHAEINSSSDSDSDSDDNCFVHPASGIVAHQPPPLLRRQPYFCRLLTNKCQRRLFY
ncbi:hypothetical protein LCGC14_2806220, partial [marine sediment metagenome]